MHGFLSTGEAEQAGAGAVIKLGLHLPDHGRLLTDAGQLASVSLTMTTEEALIEDKAWDYLQVVPYSLEVHGTSIVEMRLSESRCCLLYMLGIWRFCGVRSCLENTSSDMHLVLRPRHARWCQPHGRDWRCPNRCWQALLCGELRPPTSF